MSDERIEFVEVLRRARRCASDMRKIFLGLYGLLLFVPIAFVIVGTGRAMLGGPGGYGGEIGATFLRPVQATLAFFADGYAAGRWGLMTMVVLGVWLAAMLIGSFFGLALTRMAAVELTCQRRAEVGEAFQFTRRHWHWAFLTPASLLVGTVLLLVLAALLLGLGRASDYMVVVAAPLAILLVGAAVILIVGLLGGGLLAWPAIATEWSDAFDAVTRVYGYSFAHSYRILLYRIGAWAAWLGAVVTRGLRAALVLGLFYVALTVGLGPEKTKGLLDGVLLEPPGRSPFPASLAGWTVLACGAILLTLLLARLLVFRVVLHQMVYLLLRLRIDKVPFDNIDGYRPDDSDYDPTAQGFELVEVEGEIPAE